ncbi:MAG: LemA family protein [Acidimicrobiia bacterium]|nr:LemA family protein [Acidimicrobiia bacterium]MBV8295790.1 LemA family protein [Acidimicrobiia bacterium]
MIAIWILVGVVVLVGLFLFAAFNGLVRLRNSVQNAWAQIDVQLRRRYDLIPNLVETVKGYAAHERQTLESVTQARAQAASAQGPAQQAQAENMISSALRSLFAVAERYPDLKANQNFLALQSQLSSTESQIASARQLYNEQVRQLNTRIQSFPTNTIAGAFGFHTAEYFEADDTARGPVSVQF